MARLFKVVVESTPQGGFFAKCVSEDEVRAEVFGDRGALARWLSALPFNVQIVERKVQKQRHGRFA